VARSARETIDVKRTLKFLRALEKNNDRAWFGEHRDVWDDHIRPEWEDTIAALLVTATAFDERFAYVDPRRCLFRLYRDTRFSKDKTPYKSWISAWMSPFGKHGSNAGFYVQLCPGECIVSAGIWDPTKEAIYALRRHFADEPLREFDRLLAAKKFAPYLPLRLDPLRVTPRGFPKEHPRRDLIRLRRLTVRRTYPDAALARDGAFATFRTAMRDLAPFVAYLERVAARANENGEE
jgi:uncharacterized protein (TIGR02453 family)